MRWPHVALTGSVVAVLLGFTLVLLFSKLYVVPHLLTQDSFRTRCHINAMSRRGTAAAAAASTGCSRSNSNSDSNPDPSCAGVNGTVTPCVIVEVRYIDYDSTSQVGSLRSDQEVVEEEVKKAETPHTDQCFCRRCPLNVTTSGDDKTVTSLTSSGRVLRVGDSVRCYFIIPHRAMLSPGRTSSWVVLNAILWPSVLFIAGFVGLFFSCVLMQDDRMKRLQKKTARNAALNRSLEP